MRRPEHEKLEGKTTNINTFITKNTLGTVFSKISRTNLGQMPKKNLQLDKAFDMQKHAFLALKIFFENLFLFYYLAALGLVTGHES